MTERGRNGTNPQINVNRFTPAAPSVSGDGPVRSIERWAKRRPLLARATWLLLGALALGAVAVGGWWLATRDALGEVRHEIEKRPTVEETRSMVEDEIAGELRVHSESANPHPDLRAQVREMDAKIDQVLERVIPLTPAVKELRSEIRRLRRGRR